MISILVECYDVLYTYLMGDSRKNELYIAKHIEFFETQISSEVSEINHCLDYYSTIRTRQCKGFYQ